MFVVEYSLLCKMYCYFYMLLFAYTALISCRLLNLYLTLEFTLCIDLTERRTKLGKPKNNAYASSELSHINK